ncbi:hypothetical protein E2C01_020036 [Portunus trituberculatus]|uniref:Uncharacterized protein n=1 Tax=Portunus trituberculatus TaxID=210409 RepID=A0A5B7E090_PORTR|nr:hypothetical protein [Portunus trituberculatus]
MRERRGSEPLREGGLPGPPQRLPSTRTGAQRYSFILPLPLFLAAPPSSSPARPQCFPLVA